MMLKVAICQNMTAARRVSQWSPLTPTLASPKDAPGKCNPKHLTLGTMWIFSLVVELASRVYFWTGVIMVQYTTTCARVNMKNGVEQHKL